MKKIYLSFLLLLAITSFIFAQEQALYQFTANYFRSDPFKGEFSAFLKGLMQDPTILNKTIKTRTDTSFFFFSGTYQHYNPFFFKPKRVDIQLQETKIQYSDSLPFTDTILVYQLRAYSGGDEQGLQEIKKEAEKIHRQYNRKFYEKNSQDLSEGTTFGSIHNYFLSYYGLSPLSILWAKLEDKKECVLSIIVRMKLSANKAVLAAPLNNP